jgi:hypothetical protein
MGFRTPLLPAIGLDRNRVKQPLDLRVIQIPE